MSWWNKKNVSAGFQAKRWEREIYERFDSFIDMFNDCEDRKIPTGTD